MLQAWALLLGSWQVAQHIASARYGQNCGRAHLQKLQTAGTKYGTQCMRISNKHFKLVPGHAALTVQASMCSRKLCDTWHAQYKLQIDML